MNNNKIAITENLEQCPSCQEASARLSTEKAGSSSSLSKKKTSLPILAAILALMLFWFSQQSLQPEDAIEKLAKNFGVSFEIVGTMGVGKELAFFALQTQGTRQPVMTILIPERSGLFYHIPYYGTTQVYPHSEEQQYQYTSYYSKEETLFLIASSWGQVSSMELGDYPLHGVYFKDYTIFYGANDSDYVDLKAYDKNGQELSHTLLSESE